MKKPICFISHTTRTKFDVHCAKWTDQVLQETFGVKTIIQERDFPPGDNFKACMHTALQRADIVFGILTHDYLKSESCTEEWTNAKYFIPIKFDDCTPDGLLKSRVYINLHGLDKAAARKKLVTELMSSTHHSDEPQDQFSSNKIPSSDEQTSSDFSIGLAIGVFLGIIGIMFLVLLLKKK